MPRLARAQPLWTQKEKEALKALLLKGDGALTKAMYDKFLKENPPGSLVSGAPVRKLHCWRRALAGWKDGA